MRNRLKKDAYTVGIDEVGRGPLAGPVAVGVVRTRLARKEYSELLRGIRDSKKATEKEREKWYAKAQVWKKAGSIDFTVVFQSASYIDRSGIAQAIRWCVQKGVQTIHGAFDDEYLLDGGLRLPEEFMHQKTIIRGDSTEPLIALAATIAKVVRDRKTKSYAKKYPAYGFADNKGYGTYTHRHAIKKFGLSAIHRKTFCKKLYLK